MSRKLYSLGMVLAFCAAMLLTLPGCGSSQVEKWTPVTLVEDQPLEAPKFSESVSAGQLTLTATQKVRETKTPIERLSVLHEEVDFEFDWDHFGVVIFSILGGIASVGLYFLFGYVVVNKTKKNDN